MLNESGKPLTILRLVLALTEANAEYHQFSLPLSKKHNITICTYFRSRVSPPEEITLIEGNQSLLGYFRALRTTLAQKEYDIIHAHSSHVGVLLLAATMMRRKFLQSTVFTAHNSYPNFKLKNRLMLLLVFAFFRRVVCCGQASYESFPGFYKWLAGDRLCAVQNGMDIDRVDRVVGNKWQYRQNDKFTIASVGRLIRIKNPLSALYAFQQSADSASRLVFIGGGPWRETLMTSIKANGLGKQVTLTGGVPRDNVYEHLVEADLFISTSHGEGLPVAVLEAMACRCPVLLSDIAPHREIVDGADFIPLIQPDDVTGFAREIKRFRQMSAAERAEIGEKCRKLVEERFNLPLMHQGYEEIYAQVLDKYRGHERSADNQQMEELHARSPR